MTDTLALKVGDELEEWLDCDQPKTLGNLVEAFDPRSSALALVLLMAVPALPIPTGGATHVLEVVSIRRAAARRRHRKWSSPTHDPKVVGAIPTRPTLENPAQAGFSHSPMAT